MIDIPFIRSFSSDVSTDLEEELPELTRLALATALARYVSIFGTLFLFEQRLAQVLARTSEPIAAQLRLAWWRDELHKSPSERVHGDPVLDRIGTDFAGREPALGTAIDAYEMLIADRPLSETQLVAHAEGRTMAWVALGELIGEPAQGENIRKAGCITAYAEVATREADPQTRDRALALGNSELPTPRLPRSLRPFAFTAGLASRSIQRGGTPFLGDRMSPFAAFRLGLVGR